MPVDQTQLEQVHETITVCCDCKREFRSAKFSVVCPPGRLYPTPPQNVTVLFIGVAPPRAGEHFYTLANDGLQRGLFSVLSECGFECRTIDDFHAHGFYLSHTAKCPIAGTPKPKREVCVFCTSKYLPAEIHALQPDAVCFLSKTNGLASCAVSARALGYREDVRPSVPFQLSMAGKVIRVLVTGWPGRRGLAACRHDLSPFLAPLKARSA